MQKTQLKGIPYSQKKNIRSLRKNQQEVLSLIKKLEGVRNQRNGIVKKIFDGISKEPSRYYYVMGKGKKKKILPMNKNRIKTLRLRYRKESTKPLIFGWFGCGDCRCVTNCVCVFGIGSLCCYVCLSPGIIQCER